MRSFVNACKTWTYPRDFDPGLYSFLADGLTLNMIFLSAGLTLEAWTGQNACQHRERFKRTIELLFEESKADVVLLFQLGDLPNSLNGSCLGSSDLPEQVLTDLTDKVRIRRHGPYMVLIRKLSCIEQVVITPKMTEFRNPECGPKAQMYIVAAIKLAGKPAGALQPGPLLWRSTLVVGLAHVQPRFRCTIENKRAMVEMFRQVVASCLAIENADHVVIGGDFNLDNATMDRAMQDSGPWRIFITQNKLLGDWFVYKGCTRVLDLRIPAPPPDPPPLADLRIFLILATARNGKIDSSRLVLVLGKIWLMCRTVFCFEFS